MPDPIYQESPIHIWFELSYAQFLTIPRLVMESMPMDWQHKMAALLEQLDGTFDWRPKKGRYWVKLKDDKGRYCDAPLNDYRYGSCEHLLIKYPMETTPAQELVSYIKAELKHAMMKLNIPLPNQPGNIEIISKLLKEILEEYMVEGADGGRE